MNVTDSCESVTLENLSEPQTGCLHDYQLTPEDMVLLSKADVFIINGGGIENFLSEVASRYPNLTIIEAGEGIEMSGENAHLWMDTEKYQKQVQNIAKGLSEVDETNKKIYQKNADGADVFLFNYKGQAVGVFLSYTEGYVNIRMSSFGPADSRLMEMK